jgi:hypothetical protein
MRTDCPSLSTSDEHRMSISSASPRTEPSAFPVPVTEADCDALLDRAAELRGETENLATKIARFLGASSRVWSRARKDRLATLLSEMGSDGLRAVFVTVAEYPSAEVIGDAVRVLLRGVSKDRLDLYAALLEGAPISAPGLSGLRNSPDVRLTLIRALSEAEIPAGPQELRALTRVLDDSSEDVREAAACALGERGGAETVAALERRLEFEASELVIDSIRASLSALRG